MIKEFIDAFEKNKEELERRFSEKHPEEYIDIVRNVVEVIADESKYDHIDPKRIHQIDDGDYQGTLLFVIASNVYQPDDYWYVFVSYGSCSGCDTLQAISGYSEEKPTKEQVKDYMTLALHVVQGIKKMEGPYDKQ